MKILYLSHRLPYPPNKGEKIRVFNQLRHLAKNHSVHLCTFSDDSDFMYESRLAEYCASVNVVYRCSKTAVGLALGALLQNQPLSVKLFHRKAMVELVREKLSAEQFDCAIVSCSSVAQYISSLSDIPKIIDFIDVDSEKWRTYAKHRSFPWSSVYRREATLLARQEVRLMHEFDYSIVSSEPEAQLLRCQAKDRPISVITNGVDLDFFSVPTTAARIDDEPIIVFTGAMDYFPNIDCVRYFCDDIFPLIRNSIPNAQFYIVGRNPSRAVKKLQRQSNVFVTGSVPDVRPYLACAGVAVAPFRVARGVQNKVLESMAMGVPVVGTTEAFKGIAATEQDGIYIADDPLSFAEHVTMFLQSKARLRREIGKKTRSYVELHHRWEDQGTKLEQLIEDVVRRHHQKDQFEANSAAYALN